MAVETTGTTTGADIINFLKENNMGGILGGTGTDGSSGIIGGLILGSLLKNNGNLFNGDGNNNGHNAPAATPMDVQSSVGFINTIQDINSARRDIFQAQGAVQNQIAQSLQAETTNTLQGQLALLTAVNSSNQIIGNSIDSVNANVADQGAKVSAQLDQVSLGLSQGHAVLNQNISTVSAGTNLRISDASSLVNQNIATVGAALNQNISNSAYEVAKAITNDGDKTRALIQGIETASLNRQITVAQNEISELRNERSVTGSGINVTNNISQSQAQAQAQQQQQYANNLLSQLVNEVQRNTNSVVNLGSMTSSPQTATNVRA